jgi:hypothetical protein
MNRQKIESQLHALQVWFASHPHGWRETATPGMLQQWSDRVVEEAGLIRALERMS